MFGFSETPDAWWLTRGMARSAGVDLSGAVIEGWLTRAELDRLVGRCQSCGRTEACLGWLGRSHAGKDVPGFCAIGAEIESLAH
ncbi:MAG: DUF6455 family protein [Paracoccaceae bacterium]|nr:DUF6455 family protein [Paracoccaceae bacterium]